MIYLLYGENVFEKSARLRGLLADFAGEPERVDGETLSAGQIRDLFQGQSLFSESRLIIISDLSESSVWSDLPEIADNSDNTVILLEQKVDKRTKTYKWLQKQADVQEFTAWGDKDRNRAASWCVARAKSEYGFELAQPLATYLVERLGPDQLRLDNVLRQLELIGDIDQARLDDLVPLPKSENVFDLLKAALNSNYDQVKKIVAYLEIVDGPDGAYKTLGLLTSQLVILTGLVLGGDQAQVAKDFSANPYVVRNISSLANRVNKAQLGQINRTLANADLSMKTTGVSPWLILETALIEIANICRA